MSETAPADPFDDTEKWILFADALDAVPGEFDTGLTPRERALLTRAVEYPSPETWDAARSVRVTKRDTFWHVAMRHGGMPLHQWPTLDQATAALTASSHARRRRPAEVCAATRITGPCSTTLPPSSPPSNSPGRSPPTPR